MKAINGKAPLMGSSLGLQGSNIIDDIKNDPDLTQYAEESM